MALGCRPFFRAGEPLELQEWTPSSSGDASRQFGDAMQILNNYHYSFL
jgi:hypothetical protein